jgi:hypothetical protein
MKTKNMIVGDIISQLENKKELNCFQLLEIYFTHFPKMKGQKMKSLDRLSRIVFKLDKNQQVVAEFDGRGDVIRILHKQQLTANSLEFEDALLERT